MPDPDPVFIDVDGSSVFYLAFDLLLARAPIRDGIAYGLEGQVVELTTDGTPSDFCHAAVRAALLRAMFHQSPIWDRTVRSAERHAERLASEAGLDAPPVVPMQQIVRVRVGRATPIADLNDLA